jgi:hypothetical protein
MHWHVPVHTVNSRLHRKSIPVLPSSVCLKSLSQLFASVLSDSIHKLRPSILIQGNHSSPHVDYPSKPSYFSSFHFAFVEEVSKLLDQSPVTNCDLDPILLLLLSNMLPFLFLLSPRLSTSLFCLVFPLNSSKTVLSLSYSRSETS